jgi:transposase
MAHYLSNYKGYRNLVLSALGSGSIKWVADMFGRLKDCRRSHTRYDRCAHTFMSAICVAAVIFRL